MLLRNGFYYSAGIIFLVLAKVKHLLKGYTTPKKFNLSETDRCIDYDIQVVDRWLTHLEEYAGAECNLAGKNVLELGPGSDLGIGVYLLAKGSNTYNACDVNNLVKDSPDFFYDKLIERLQSHEYAESDLQGVKEQLSLARKGQASRLNYQVRDDFDLVAAFGDSTMDLVVSQAAFEHFDDIDLTASRLSQVCRPGAVAVIEIDLKTHSRWIRENDPNNIYRYPDWLYRLFWFRGIPNRKRPYQYKQAFERAGWADVVITAIDTDSRFHKAHAGMHQCFAAEQNQMDCLSIVLCARKPWIA